MIQFVPGDVARTDLGPFTDEIDDGIEFMGYAGKVRVIAREMPPSGGGEDPGE